MLFHNNANHLMWPKLSSRKTSVVYRYLYLYNIYIYVYSMYNVFLMNFAGETCLLSWTDSYSVMDLIQSLFIFIQCLWSPVCSAAVVSRHGGTHRLGSGRGSRRGRSGTTVRRVVFTPTVCCAGPCAGGARVPRVCGEQESPGQWLFREGRE